MAERITIKDIARELNIHHSTVSRALRNDSRVKQETRDRILSYASKHGYKVNMNALQLRGSVRNIIAVIVPNIHHGFFSNMVSRIANQAKKDDYIVSVFQSNESLEEEKEVINTLIQNNVAGVIASLSLETQSVEHYKELKKFGIPLVLFDRVSKEAGAPCVTVNNFEIVKQGVDLLVNRGYTKIAHITGPGGLNVFRDRRNGYLEGVQEHQLAYHQVVSINTDFTPEDGKQAVKELFGMAETPDALIVDSHNLMLGVYQELHRMGKTIPDHVGVIGFGDNPSVDVIQPAITTIVQPEEEIARSTYSLLKEQIDAENPVVVKHMVLESEIVLRNSC